MADKRTYIPWINTVKGVDGVPPDTLYYFLRTVGTSYDADVAAFRALSPEQKIALSTTTKPVSASGWAADPATGFGSAKLKELYIARNPDGTLSFYADGTGDLFLSLTAVNPGAVNADVIRKKMTTADGPYPRPGLFTGSKPYGSYMLAIPNGDYRGKWEDEDGAFLSFGVTLTGSLPLYRLFGGSAAPTPTDPTDPTTPPITPQNYTSKGVLGGYVAS